MGFFNVTLGGASPNMTVCLSNVTRIVDVSIQFGDHVKVISNDSWALASQDFQNIFETIHPIFFSCYRSGFEFYSAILDYGLTFTNWRNLVYNLIHNLGYIYDAVYFLVVHHKAGEKELKAMERPDKVAWWFKLGVYYGNIVKHILYSDV